MNNSTTTPLLGTSLYPCNRGIVGGLPSGYHYFQASAHGVCCIYCGAVPRVSAPSDQES